MSVFLLVWNPKRWNEWEEHLDEVAQTAAGRVVTGAWSMSTRRSGISPGDQLLLLRQLRAYLCQGANEAIINRHRRPPC